MVGPGPGILGSATRLGHGGMAALDAAHAALALGLPTLLCPRLSSSDERDRHRGLSHHTAVGARAAAGARCGCRFPRPSSRAGRCSATTRRRAARPEAALDALIDVCRRAATTSRSSRSTSTGTRAAACPTTTMGRTIAEDPLFFAAPLAAGRALAAAVGG